MRIGAFEVNEPVPELRDPHVFAMIRPWVDVGSVGTLTLNRLERFMGSKELGRLARPGAFFDFTRYRPSMRLVDGVREVKIPNSTIRYAVTDEGSDYLFLHLLEPHSNGEDYTDAVMEVVNYFGVKRYCRLGAMYAAVPHTRPLLVTGSLGTVEQKRTVPNFKLQQSTYQGPTTIMNLLSEEIEQADIELINFMVHLPQYVQLEEDYAGASRMIVLLHAHSLGFSAVSIALMFVLYELAGVVTTLLGGVYGARDQLLAGTALAADQHRRPAGRRPRHHVERLLHGRVDRDDAFKAGALF